MEYIFRVTFLAILCAFSGFHHALCTQGKKNIKALVKNMQIEVKNKEDFSSVVQNPSLLIKKAIQGYEMPGFAEILVLGHFVQNKFKKQPSSNNRNSFITSRNDVHTIEEAFKDDEIQFSNFLDNTPQEFQLKALAFSLFSIMQPGQQHEKGGYVSTANGLKEKVFSARQYASLLMRNNLKANESPEIRECLDLGHKVSRRLQVGKIRPRYTSKIRILEALDEIPCLSFEGMPAEIQWEIVSHIIPETINSSDELVEVLETIQALRLTSKFTRRIVRSKYFLNFANIFFNSINDADIFLQAANKLKLKALKRKAAQKEKEKSVRRIPEIFKLFKEMSALLKKIKTADDKGPIIEEYLNRGFNPYIIFKDRIWMGPEKVDFVNKNLLNYVNLRKYPDLAMKLLELGVVPEHICGPFFLLLLAWTQKHNVSYQVAKNLFKMLIEKGIDPNTTFEFAQHKAPLLFYAIHSFRDLELVELLLQKGADPKKEYAVDWFNVGFTKLTVWKDAKRYKKTGDPEFIVLFRKYSKDEKN